MRKIKLIMIQVLQLILYLVPVKKNRIMFYAHNRKGYVCNPAALLAEIQHKSPGKYELIWVTRFPETCTNRDDITVVRQRSVAYFIAFIRTKYFITNDMVDEALVKKRKQIFISTWHGGGAYKKVGIDTITEDPILAENFHKWYGRLDYFVSSCEACTDMYTKAFHLNPDIFLPVGTPRNDIFFRQHNEIPEKVRDFFHIPEQTKIILFAPSFQISAPEKEHYNIELLVNCAKQLQKETGTFWVILYRSHYFREAEEIEQQAYIRDGSSYYEMQELLYAADILVTDFSSCIWDFALTGRPIFLLENRLREYEREDRGFFVPYQTWPYVRIESLAKLPSAITQYGSTDFTAAYQKHMQEMGTFETGNASEQIINTIIRGV